MTFRQFAKIEVNGEKEVPLYTWLKAQKKGIMGSRIKWNFTKFLINREGNVVGRYVLMATPEELAKAIRKIL